MPYRFISSDGGVELAPEVCIRVVEEIIGSDPKALKVLMCLSKAFYSLLKTYETSITRNLSVHNPKFAKLNVTHPIILPSRASPESIIVKKLSYAWLSEMHFRSSMTDFLICHNMTELNHLVVGWYSLRPPAFNLFPAEELQRVQHFKKRAFELLYQLGDSTAGLIAVELVRAEQSGFLESRSATELATMGCLVKAMGLGYFRMMKTNSQKSEALTRESMCVFEDRLLRFGPYFAWVYVTGRQRGNHETRRWAHSVMQQGLDTMNDFELGHKMSYASLQSVLWHAFCEKAGCSLYDHWNVAKTLVKLEMTSYKFPIVDG